MKKKYAISIYEKGYGWTCHGYANDWDRVEHKIDLHRSYHHGEKGLRVTDRETKKVVYEELYERI